jgi:signal transduction histidine kinase
LLLSFGSAAIAGLRHLFEADHGDSFLSISPLNLPWYVPIAMLVATSVSNMGFLGLVFENDHVADRAKTAALAEEESRSRMAEVLGQMDRSSNLNVISFSLGLQLSQPLAAIKLNSQLLQKRLARPNATSAELTDGLDQVIEQVRACAGIVDQVRQFIKPPKLKPTLVDLQQLTREVWDLLRQEAQQKGAQLEFPPELPGMHGSLDRLRTSQVLMNLLRSATEGLQLGASGTIRVRFRRTDDGVDVIIVVPWPQPVGDAASALAVRLQAHAVVFQSRVVAARATLAEFGGSASFRDVAPHHREFLLHFLGSHSPAGERKMERA